ncbi:acyl CoA--acetate/3-ketoacid CoA transferase subunit alpha [Microbacterium sp. zg.Y1090]|uniref:CoA transferase subunit A n=1 Tax=Microbacterium TaxID=33882 RepID=UPI00214B6747|nr:MULTISPECIES: CoA-transferase [unclassified Microbacterium]MCR2813323.1 acyl CoA--acetate/3-ketoacid CoA transferase subunit alpha [Microbacterium sp. zg.Y1084]MCR2819843.1 acyl CoA--acetate/3-ketoacid CoA transferase subunit alpha [Microbacterium sp. zg.Y1090]MDL5487954.1 CoA-transferase [Microbacterium sp. zg-Y1211]WIM28600.1 CoA-transferase [Microbacterium sp. zg-Y1090]
MSDKRSSIEEAVASLESGMTIGIGGWGSRRKPMALVREMLRRDDLTDLTVVAFGGPDVGLLAAAGRIRRLVYGFVSLDSIPLDPLFTRAREQGLLEIEEYDEGMFVTGLRAAAARLDFLPIRAGLGSDVLPANPHLRTVRSPYSDAEYVAMPALPLDVALVHMNRADQSGNAQFLGPDPYFDDLFAMAAQRTIVSAEQVVPTEDLLSEGSFHTLLFSRMYVSTVVEAPRGAHFTTCEPDYGRDEAFQRHYATSAKDPDAWQLFDRTFLQTDEAGYHRAVAQFHAPEGDA